MMRLRSFGLVAFCTLFLALPAVAQTAAEVEARQLVEQMAQSARVLNYSGYFTYERGMQSASYQVLHQVKNNQEKQRLVFLDGKPLEVINDGHSLKCLHASGENLQSAEHQGDLSAFMKLNQPLANIWQLYQAELIGLGRIAGRDVSIVHLHPKDQHRFPFMFYIDQQTGLMLKMLVLDQQGRLLERFRYVAIDYTAIADQAMMPQIKNYSVVDHSVAVRESRLQQATEKWTLSWLPQGFKRELQKMPLAFADVNRHEALMYSDGLSAFSVFIEAVKEPVRKGTSRRMGSTAVVTRYLPVADNVYQITVVGEIPLSSAQQLAAAVRPVQ